MFKIKENITDELVIEKSVFITSLFRVKSVDEVNMYLESTRKKHYDATHNCYAYILNKGINQKCSDDGEPQKTAGYPMLEVLKKKELTDILAITTRYYGGKKLGAGGLIRAYSKGVSEAAKKAIFVVETTYLKYSLKFDYSFYEIVRKMNEVKIIESDFSNLVDIKVLIELTKETEIINKIKELTSNKVIITFVEEVSLDI